MYSNLWIGLGAVGFTLNYYIVTQTDLNYSILGFVFFATIFTYTFQRLVKIKQNINTFGDRVKWMNENPILVYAILVTSACLSLYFGIKFWENVLLLLLFSGVMSFFYVWKIPFLKNKSLRDIPSIKIYVIALVWVLISVVIPVMVNDSQNFSKSIWLLMISELLFMIAITIPFDVRDIKLDDSSKKTIPQVIGVKKSNSVAVILLVLSQILLIFAMGSFNIGVILVLLITVPLLYFSKPTKSDMYFSGLIDGVLICQPILLYFLGNY